MCSLIDSIDRLTKLFDRFHLSETEMNSVKQR